ncbi:MAG: aminotransferase class IV [Deltaproteobacteria bacterium]|nr:aminotransferase class IV [Deltaproteobacteria bacterium]
MSGRDLVLLLNDRLVPARRATISALDRGFVYGDGLFETVRTYRGRPCGLARHLRRLARSARVFRIPFDGSLAHWEPRVRRVLRANDLLATDAAVRLTVSRGAGPFGIVPPPRPKPTVMMLATPVDPRIPVAQARGVTICFFPFRLVTATLPSHKTLHYLPAVLGKMIARRRGAWEAVYLGADDTVLEGTTSNVFAVTRGRLVTPPLHGILPGVTRHALTTLAKRAGIPLVERPLTRRALLAADEVLLTASTIEVLPVVRIETVRIGNGTPGPITRRLQDEYRRHVARTLAARRVARATRRRR